MILRILFGCFVAIAFGQSASAEPVDTGQSSPGVSDTEVRFLQIAALEGAASALGSGMRLGIEAAFSEVNASGGVHGRTLLLESRDDGYQPGRSVQLLEEGVASNAYFALIGSVGTPTASALLPKVRGYGLPMVGPFTGAGFLRDVSNGPVVNLRASYAAEAEAWMQYLVDERGFQSIAILYQDDAFGRVGLTATSAALERREMELVAEGTYTRNSRAVKEALLELRAADPEAVVMVGAYKPVAEFIRRARELAFTPTFVNISFVGSKALASELQQDGAGVIISQVVPFPWSRELPIVDRYQKALFSLDPDSEPGFVSLEGYLVGRLAIAALQAAGPVPTRQEFLASFERLGEIDIDGLALKFGPHGLVFRPTKAFWWFKDRRGCFRDPRNIAAG